MTDSPEDRAEKLDFALSLCSGPASQRHALITQALRQAEDAAYERAAAIADARTLHIGDMGFEGASVAMSIAAATRALKSEQGA